MRRTWASIRCLTPSNSGIALMKVFLSHSTKDKQFVQTLAAELQAEKIEPWLCEVDIEFGQNFVAKIQEGLRAADLTVLFWSPEGPRVRRSPIR